MIRKISDLPKINGLTVRGFKVIIPDGVKKIPLNPNLTPEEAAERLGLDDPRKLRLLGIDFERKEIDVYSLRYIAQNIPQTFNREFLREKEISSINITAAVVCRLGNEEELIKEGIIKFDEDYHNEQLNQARGNLPQVAERERDLGQLLKDNVEAIVDKIREEGEKNGVNFLDMIPSLYREQVDYIGRYAYQERLKVDPRIREIGRDEFINRIALCWLAQREVFRLIGEKFNFRKAEDMVPTDFNGAILALTVNGSIVAFSKPLNFWQTRNRWYVRIKEREDSLIKPLTTDSLTDAVKEGEIINTGSFHSSQIIELLTNDQEIVNDEINKAIKDMRESFINVEHHTVYPEGE